MGKKAGQVNDNQAPQLPSLELELEVPFADVDSQRIVWHGNYLRYFELARVQLFALCDLFPLIEEGHVDFVVSESYCKHYHPLTFRDRFSIRVSFADIDHRLNMRFLITKADGTKIAKGHTIVVSLCQGKLQLVTPAMVSDRIYAAATKQSFSPETNGDEVTSSPRRRFIVATAALFGSLAWSPGAHAKSALPEDLRKLLARHARSKGLRGRFVEEKHIAFLKAPLKNEGYLAYKRPDRFARVVERPAPSKIVARGNTLAFREGNGPKTELSLTNRPELKALIEGIIFLLSGNATEIEKLYEVIVKRGSPSCQVELIPKDKRMRALVKKFVVNAKKDSLESFEVHERSGDYSVTRLLDLDLNHQFSKAEEESLFSI